MRNSTIEGSPSDFGAFVGISAGSIRLGAVGLTFEDGKGKIMKKTIILIIVAVLAVAVCHREASKAKVKDYADAVKDEARQAEIERAESERPGATHADAVEYQEAARKLQSTIMTARESFVTTDVLENARQLGISEGRKIVEEEERKRHASDEKR